MEQLLSTILRAIFVDNMIFAYYLGMCSYLAVSKNVKTALGLGIAVTFVLVCTLPINYMLENYVLKEGALSWLGADFGSINLSFLSLIIFIAVIASFVQLVEMVVEKYAPSLYASLGIFLPLIAVNCAILGGSLFMQQKSIPKCRHCDSLWFWFRYWMAVGNCRYGSHTRKTAILRRTQTSKGIRNNLHYYRFDGYCLHEFLRD